MALVFSIYFCTCFIYSYDKALANAVRFFAKNDIASIKVITHRKKHIFTDVLFRYIRLRRVYAQVRDMSFGRDMRFARWKLQGE